MRRFRLQALILGIVVAVVLTMLFDHGLRVRLIWGTSGFALGLVCGIALILRIQHRRKEKKAAVGSPSEHEHRTTEHPSEGRP
jgi:peptidoglycan/LPS O-acetylase OafA/YrhL